MNPAITETSLEDRSPHASAHYRELVEEANREPVKIAHDYDLTDAVSTWDRLTACESEVFGIEPQLLNSLIFAHMRYEDLIGVTDIEFFPYRAEERVAYPEWFKGECIYSIDDAIAFMVLVCRLPATQALAWVCRAKIQQIRSGLIDDAVESPPRACCNVSEPIGWAGARVAEGPRLRAHGPDNPRGSRASRAMPSDAHGNALPGPGSRVPIVLSTNCLDWE